MQKNKDSQGHNNKTSDEILREVYDLPRTFFFIDMYCEPIEEITLELIIKEQDYIVLLNSINTYIEVLEAHYLDTSLDEETLNKIIEKLELLQKKKPIVQKYLELYLAGN